MNSYVKLGIAALIPVAAAVLFYLLEKRTKFKDIPYIARQVIIGVIFGGIAIVGTEWGIPMNGAQVNCRDAAPLCAGLFFGAPAGIIAGVIGGVERWIAVAWGVGSFTRVACSVSTVIAGCYAAILRKYLLDNSRPGWFLALETGLVIEVFHLSMVFVTNMSQAARAAAVVKVCSFPMILACGLSVMLSGIVLTLLDGRSLRLKSEQATISSLTQRGLLVCVVLGYLITTVFMAVVETGITNNDTERLMQLSIEDLVSSVDEEIDGHIMDAAETVAQSYQSSNMLVLATNLRCTQVNVVDKNGIIVNSNLKKQIGFDMSSTEQTAEFLCLLEGETQMIQDYCISGIDNRTELKTAAMAVEDGFVQVCFNQAVLNIKLADRIQTSAHNRRIGENGYLLVLDADGRLVSQPDGKEFTTLADASISLSGQKQDAIFTTGTSDEPLLCMYSQKSGYTIVAVQPQEEAMDSRDTVLYISSFMQIMVFAVVFLLVYLLIKKYVVNNMNSVNRDLTAITEGDLGVELDVRQTTEFSFLSDAINATVMTLKEFIIEAAARIDSELEFAKSIQSSALPNVFPAFPNRKDFDIYALMATSKEVGGDFYDFYFTGHDRLQFLIADVSGKGIPAALFMMRAKTQLKSLAETGIAINDVFTQGNAHLCEGNDAGMFVTAWQGSLDPSSGLVEFANAGHNPPLVKHAGGQFEYLRSRAGFVLAGMDMVKYKMQELQLNPGDIIFLYTDGVTEATDSKKQLYGEDRLLKILNSRQFDSMETLCKVVKEDVDAFVGTAPQFDDITMVALQYFGKNGAAAGGN